MPPEMRLVLDPSVRRPRPEVLVGGAPLRVLRLAPAGAGLLDRWSAGEPVGAAPGAQALARRLLDGGLAHPRWDRATVRARASVVIPVRDRPDGLARTLTALGQEAREVIVVDDGSEDAAAHARAATSAGARLVRRQCSGGPAAARNDGWRASSAEVVVFVDADCIPAPGWEDVLMAHFADPALGAAAPRMVTGHSLAAPRWMTCYEATRSPLDLGCSEAPVRPAGRVPYVPSAALAVRRSALDDVGGFDESLRFGEDVDLVWRLAESHWRVRYDPAAQVVHPSRDGLAAWLRPRYHYGTSAAPLATRHPAAVAPLSVSPWSAAVWVLALAGRPLAAMSVAAATAAALGRKAGGDPETEAMLRRAALVGHLRAGEALAGAIRRAWLLPVLGAVAATRRGRKSRSGRAVRAATVASVVLPPVVEWGREHPRIDPVRWWLLRQADDGAYQAGVWVGALRARSAAALLPRSPSRLVSHHLDGLGTRRP